MYELLIDPFLNYGFMRRAFVGCLIVSFGAVPVGIFMTLRRMSLTGDAMAHAILPGAAIAYLISGVSLFGLTLGGTLAGLVVVALAGWVARSSHLKEDTSLAAFYLISLALGVLVISLKQSNVDLFHVLFGNILALDDDALSLLAFISTVSILIMSILYRPLIIECVDSTFLRRSGNASATAHYGFLFLMVINLVLPATAARFWAKSLDSIVFIAFFVAIFGCYLGLLMSFYFDLPSGPAIIIAMGGFCVTSILIGENGGLFRNRAQTRHLTG